MLKSAARPPGETPPSAPPVRKVQSVPIAPPPAPQLAEAPPILAPTPKPAAQSVAAQVQLPVPVTFKALVTEQGPKLQSGLTWRVFAAKASPDGGGYQLLSTHREAVPTAALLPGEYLVNAAYGLSNLTKKIKVESGRSLEETFVLNTGGLKLTAALANGEVAPEGAVKFDILSDEEDQRGNRQTILHNAKAGLIIRLNAGAYRIESLYGDANAIVRADVTVEPGKVTEATIKQTGSKTTFKLVQSLGGEALADTKWTILTSAGDVVKENAGALPTHILSPGSYAVVADHGGLSYTRKFSIEAGDEAKQVEVVVGDGPTSPEDLKALTDPPEPPPVPAGAGVVAGDGQAPSPGAGVGFDGFSRDRARRPQCAADQSRHSAARRALARRHCFLCDVAITFLPLPLGRAGSVCSARTSATPLPRRGKRPEFEGDGAPKSAKSLWLVPCGTRAPRGAPIADVSGNGPCFRPVRRASNAPTDPSASSWQGLLVAPEGAPMPPECLVATRPAGAAPRPASRRLMIAPLSGRGGCIISEVWEAGIMRG